MVTVTAPPHRSRITRSVIRASTAKEKIDKCELVLKDMFDSGVTGTDLEGYDTCFFCLGVSSAGMNEADYTRLTYDRLSIIGHLSECLSIMRANQPL